MIPFNQSNRKLPKAITEEEFRIFIETFKGKKTLEKLNAGKKYNLVAFLLAYESGLRISEVLKIKKEDIQENQINIWLGKGQVDRTVPKPKTWRSWMIDFIPIERSARILQSNFKKTIRAARLPEHYTFHSLRHGFATRCVEKGMPITQVQLLMGHSNVATTSIYTKARPIDALKSYGDLF